MKKLILKVCREFRGILIDKAEVHKSANLKVLADICMEKGVIGKIKKRRQGAKGKRNAENHLLRRVLAWARREIDRPIVYHQLSNGKWSSRQDNGG